MVRFVKPIRDNSSPSYKTARELLFDDVGEIEDQLAANDTQFIRRMYTRALFAYMEADVHSLSEKALARLATSLRPGDEIPIYKLALLSGKTAELEDTGKISIKSARVATAKWTAFVLRAFAETVQVDPKDFFADDGWRALKDSLRVRDRITHPKELSQLEITDTEMAAMKKAATWLINYYIEILNISPLLSSPKVEQEPSSEDSKVEPETS